MSYQNDTVCHFRHCARIYSAAQDQGLMYLTAEVSGGDMSTFPTGNLICTLVQNSWRNQRFWLLTDRPGEPAGNEGIGYLADTFTGSLASDHTFFHNYGCAAALGNLPTADHTTPNVYDSREQWVFIADNDAFVIMKPGTQLCLTAGPNPSNSIGSTSVSCYLTTWGGYDNQRWILMDPLELCNVYQIAPVLDPAMCIASPGQTTQDRNVLGVEAYDETDPTATWQGWNYSDGYWGYFAEMHYLGRPTTPDDEAFDWLSVPSSVGTDYKLIQRLNAYPQGGGQFFPKSLFNPTYCRQYTGDQYGTATGIYFGHQWGDSVAASASDAMSSSDGTLALASSPWVHAISSTTTSDNAAQFWLSLPRNLYDAGLPTPYGLQIRCHDITDGTSWILSSTDEIPSGHNIELIPRFICDWDAYVAVMRIRYKDQNYRLAGEGWDEWDVVLSPTNGNLPTLREAPWAIPDGPEAWVPNAWAGTVGADGYRELTKGFSLPSGLFSGHNGQIAQVSVTVKAFSYGREHYFPWAPYAGPGATFTTMIEEKPIITLSSPFIAEDGLHISYSVTDFPGANQLSLAFDDLSVDYIHNWVLTTLDRFLAEPWTTMLASSAGSVVIPMEQFDGDAMLTLIEAFAAGDTGMLNIQNSIRCVSQFSSQVVSGSYLAIDMEANAYSSSASLSAANVGQWATIYANYSAMSWTYSYQITATERGPRLMRLMDGSTSILKYACHLTGQTFGPGNRPQATLICRRDSNTYLAYAVIRASVSTPRIVASLSWLDRWHHIHVIPIEGTLSFSYGSQRSLESAQRLGGRSYLVGTNGGETPTIKFSGTLYKGALAGIAGSTNANVILDTDLSDIYRIPDDVDVYLRTTYATAYKVRISRIESPRDNSQMTPVTIQMVEVES